MSRSRRRQLYILCTMVIAGALAELATIAAVVPFVALLAGTSGKLPIFQEFLIGFGSPQQQLLAATGLFAAAAIVAGAIRIGLTWVMQSFSFGFGHDLALAIQTRLLYQPYGYHTSTNSGDLVAAHEKVFAFIHGAVLPALNGLAAAVTSIFIIAILAYIDTLAATFAVAAIAILYLSVTWLSRERLRLYGDALNASQTERVRAVQESLGGIRNVILDQSQPAHLRRFAGTSRRYSRAEMMAAFVSATPRYAIEALGMVLIAAFALVLSRGGNFSEALPVLAAMALSAQRLLPLLQQVYQGWAQLRTGSAYAGELATLLQLADYSSEDQAANPQRFAFTQSIRFEGVRFRYSTSDFVLNGVDLTITRGSRVALAGQTGSGKSTLLDLLMGLLDPSAGVLAIDDVPLTAERRGAWQMQIAHVPQSIFLADASIAQNVAYGHDESDVDLDRVRWAARLAEAQDFIEALPETYQTSVGERGIRLSGGQRQCIGIARALYKQAPMIILDEATSALDDETEAAIMQNIAGLGPDVTVLVVAHRQSSLSCDRLVRLENGIISEASEGAVRPLIRSAI